MQNIITAKGRLVQGHPMEGQTTDSQGKPKVIKTGPNAGQPMTTYFGAVAFQKIVNGVPNPEWAQLWAQLDAEARASYPQYFNGPLGADGKPTCTHPRFTYKVMDGDGVDSNGKPNSTKEGFAGCWVLKFSSQYPPRCFYEGRFDPMQQIQNKAEIQTGDYVRVAGNIAGNIGSDVPGLYVNWNLVSLMEKGTPIVSGPNAADVFGAVPAQPFAGAVAGPGSAPPLPGAITPAPGLPSMGPANTVAPPLPGAAVQPNHAFVQNAMGTAAAPPLPPAAPPAPPLPPAAPRLVLTAAATQAGYTLESFRASGWGDEQIIAGGWAVRQ